jgi:hypothetical protein
MPVYRWTTHISAPVVRPQDYIWVNIGSEGIMLERENQSTQRRIRPHATNLTWTELGANPFLRSEKPAVNSLNNCKATRGVLHFSSTISHYFASPQVGNRHYISSPTKSGQRSSDILLANQLHHSLDRNWRFGSLLCLHHQGRPWLSEKILAHLFCCAFELSANVVGTAVIGLVFSSEPPPPPHFVNLINPLKPNGNCTSHMLQQSVVPRFHLRVSCNFHSTQGLFA